MNLIRITNKDDVETDDNEGRGLQALFPVGMNPPIKQDDVQTDT